MNHEMIQKDTPILSSYFFDRIETAYKDIENLKSKISKIEFKDSKVKILDAPLVDLSDNYDYSVVGCLEHISGNDTYILYILVNKDVSTSKKIYTSEIPTYLFAGFWNVTEISFGNVFQTSNAIFMDGMFSECHHLKSLDLSSFDTSQTVSLDSFFQNCFSLEAVNLDTWNTDELRSTRSMFKGCLQLKTLDLSHFDLKCFDSSKKDLVVNHMDNIFEGCTSLQTLQFPILDRLQETDTSYMFEECLSLQTVNGRNFSITLQPTTQNKPVLSRNFMWRLLKGYEKHNPWNLRYCLDKIEFVNRQSIKLEIPGWIIYEEIDLSEARDGSVIGRVKYNPTKDYETLQIFADETVYDTSQIYAPKDSSHLFEYFISLKEIEFNDVFDTAYTTNMCGMFNQCHLLKKLELNHFDTSNVTDISWMFCECLDLEVLNLRTFDTSKVTDMSWMFANCQSLILLLLDGFDTRKVTEMTAMFSTCKCLKELDLRDFDTQNVTSMRWMFSGCENLENANLSSFDLQHEVDVQNMFDACEKLKNYEDLLVYTHANDKKQLTPLFKKVDHYFPK